MSNENRNHYAIWLFDQTKDEKWTPVAKSGMLQSCSQWTKKWNDENDDVVAIAWPTWNPLQPDGLRTLTAA